MRVTRLQLQGFKSFASPTELDLGGGITAIVGPNGSGKSNLVDAIRLVLGGASARELRGQRLDHVIFAGGERRAPQGMAEVSITFDNEDGRLPVEDLEVSLSRRVFRDGGSEFRRNGERVRLRDVYRLLEATGLAQSGYAVIAQNDIEAIIRASPTQRRHLVEEAAGVRGTQALLDESASRMAALDQWLEGSGGRLAELWPQIERLRAEARLAGEAAELQDRIRELRGGLERSAWLEALAEARRVERQLQGARRSLAQVRTDQSAYELVYREQRQELERGERLRLDHERRMGELALSRQRLEAEAARWEERAVQAARDRAASARLQQEAVEDLEQLGPDAGELDAGFAPEAAQRLAALETGLAGLEVQRAALRAEVASAQAELTRQEFAVQAAGRTAERLQVQVDLATTQIRRAEEGLQALGVQGADLERRVGADQEALAAADQELEAAESELGRAVQAEAAARQTLRSLEAALEAAERGQRHAAAELAEAEVRAQEAGSSRPIAAAARAGQLALRPMAESLRPLSPADAAAVDAGLGELAAALLGTEEEARRGLERRGGVAEVVAWGAPAQSGGAAEPPPGCRPLSEAVTGDRLALAVVAGQLAQVCLAEDREAAGEWLRREPRGRAVLPDGTVLGSGWERTPAGDGGAIVGAERLRTLQAERERRGQQVLEAQGQAEWAAGQHRRSQDAVDEARAELSRRRAEADGRRAQASRGEAELLELSRRRAALEAELESHRPRVAVALEELAVARAEGEAAAHERAMAEERGRRAGETLTRVELQLEEALAEAGVLRSQRAEAEARREASSRLARERAAQRERLSARALAAARGVAEAEAAAASSLLRLRAVRGELSQLVRQTVEEAGAMAGVAGAAAAAGAAGSEAEPLSKLAELERRRADLAADVRRAEESVTGLESQLADRVAVAQRLRQGLGGELEAEADGTPVEDPARTAQEISRLERRLGQLGPVNALAPGQLEELLRRTEGLREAHQDVESARQDLAAVAATVGRLTAARYRTTLVRVASEFESVWKELFGGGRARLVSVAGADSELPGVDLEVQPRGKRVIPLGLLSGGERALTALALVLAIQLVSPSPFYVFDEVDAALDEVNVGNFVRLLRQRSRTTQFVVVTHSLATMAAADRLYGVTQDGRGASRVLSVRLGADGSPVEDGRAREAEALA